MRILTITSSYPKYASDTTAPFIASITRALAERGHELRIVLPQRSDLDPEPIEGVTYHPYRYAPTEGLSVFGYAEALRADVALRGATYVAAPLAVLSGARALLAESKQPFDVLHAHWVVPNGAMAVPAARRRGLPLVVSLHGSDVFLSEKKSTFRSAAKLAFGEAAAATACSDDLAERSLGLGAREKPLVIPYGVDTDVFGSASAAAAGRALRSKLSIPAETTTVLAVGRLVSKKGFEYLLEACGDLVRRGRDVTYVLAGKGDLEPVLMKQAEKAGIRERLRLVGNVERDELPGLFAMADIVAVPSVRDRAGNVDGLPNVLLEAMASGRAIVASDVAGIPQAVRADRDGLLVPQKDARAIAAAIERLLDAPETRAALGSSARRRAEDAFSWNLVGERFESVLRSVAEARRRAS